MRSLDHLISNVIRNTSQYNVLLVRGGQSMGSHAGSLVGWTDSRLTVKGREQSNELFKELYKHIDTFSSIASSDLSRSYDTARIALGFPSRTIIKDNRLREINFGKEESKHFDSLPNADKERINSMEYCAPDGESWSDVYKRVINYYQGLPKGLNLLFTHGGSICAQTYKLGLEDMIPHCSAVCLRLDNESR